MRKHSFYFILLSLLFVLLHGSSSLAAMSCTRLFSVETNPLLKNIESRLSKLGYEKTDNVLYKISTTGQKEPIGTIEVINPLYLYEWQDQEYHEAWVSGDGINAADMNRIIASPPQAIGRGFYVSLDPVDSSYYGTHLTIFETSKPLVILYSGGLDKVFNDEKTVNDLRQIGFAGARGTATWLNIFNESYLGNAKEINTEILANMLVKKNQVQPFLLSTLFSKKSIIDSLQRKSKLKKVFQLSVEKSPQGQLQASILANLFLKDPKTVISILKNEKNQLSVIKAMMNSLVSAEFLTTEDAASKNLMVAYLSKVMAYLPKANSFFALFDAFDVATIGNKKMKEPISYETMLKASESYNDLLQDSTFEKIKSADSFRSVFAPRLGLNFEVRSADVVMSSYQKSEYYIKVGADFFQALSQNIFLSVNTISARHNRQIPSQSEYVLEPSYFSLDNLTKTKHLFTAAEYVQVQSLLTDAQSEKNKKAALQMAINILYKKLFDPSQFELMGSQFPNEKMSAYTLYKTFVSLHPFKDGNGRAARLYYHWLVKNHFKDEPEFLNLPVHEADLFIRKNSLDVENQADWLLTRLWMLSAKDEKTMVLRAGEILRKNKAHKFFTQQIGDIRELVGP